MAAEEWGGFLFLFLFLNLTPTAAAPLASTLGELPARLARYPLEGETSSDIAAFATDRPALVESGHPVSWLV